MKYKFRRMVSLLLAASMLFSLMAVGVSAVQITQKPANNITTGQPFAAGTGGSNNFRIPGIVTLNNGTLIAACDARWNGTADAGGLDTIVSVSRNNGETWEYTFANYFGDNGDNWINTSSCIIDPAIATDGTTAYMIADLFPAGFAINSARYKAQRGSTGFDQAGNLILRSDAENGISFGSDTYADDAAKAVYGYYLRDGKIWTTAGTEVAGYAVDAHFNIKGEGVDTNLFFSDSPYKPFPTDYLYMTTSTDGLTWSDPELLNLKAADEQTLLIGPGNGTYNKADGRMVFTAYEYDFGTQNTALVWKDTDGKWYRSENVATTSWTSEATCVALNDGTVRVFYRDGYSVLRYTDMIWDEAAHNYVRDPEATEISTKAVKRSNNQLTSLVYSQKIDGKDVILVSCAANIGERRDGRLYVFLLNDDKTMELAYAYDIIPGENEAYAYNCISEMSDGRIALLYEGDNPDTNAHAEIIFTTIDMNDVVSFENDARLNFIDVEISEGETWTLKDTTGNYTISADSAHDSTVAEVTASGVTATVPAVTAMNSGVKTALTNVMYTLTRTESGSWYLHHTLSDGTVVYIDAHAGSGNGGFPNRDYTTELTLVNGTASGTFWIKDSGGFLHLFKNKDVPCWDQCGNPCGYSHDLMFLRPARNGETESAVFPGFVQVTNMADLTDGGEYLIAGQADNGSYYVLNPALGGGSKESNDHLAQFTGNAEVSATTVTITGLKQGETRVMVGSNVYNITVTGAPEVPAEELTIFFDGSVYFILDGEYCLDDVIDLDTSVATVDIAVTGDRQVYGELRHNSNRTQVALSDCQYTFTAAGSAWRATIAKDDKTWYVRPNAKGHSVNQTDLALTFNTDGSVYIKDSSHYLYVNRNTLAWDRTGSIPGYEPHITFYIYGEGEDASSPIPGYKLITANDQITSGNGYLIAFYDANGQLYVMNPTTRKADAYNQMAAVVNKLENAVTHVTINAVSEGETTFWLAGNKYHITVLPEDYD
ncbi:MAG: exo-alpha-sialidase, partial [Oscillospiraceae bacterium]|nr:exo-alpha-sialidase [Oscillospiraceae bacterium]